MWLFLLLQEKLFLKGKDMSSIVKIKENRDFRRAYNRGKSFVCPFVAVYINKNRTENVRLGITAGKKIGNAVCRNRAKRVIYAAFRACEQQLPPGYDFVIVARTRILSVKSTEVARSLSKIFSSVFRPGEAE